jgi:hypothetical protein
VLPLSVLSAQIQQPWAFYVETEFFCWSCAYFQKNVSKHWSPFCSTFTKLFAARVRFCNWFCEVLVISVLYKRGLQIWSLKYILKIVNKETKLGE